jgi:hypothetical protein
VSRSPDREIHSGRQRLRGDVRRRLGLRLAWQQRLHAFEQGGEVDAGRLADLRRWQSERLATSFADFLANPRERAAAQFFLSDLYGDRDFSGRDRDAARILPMMARILPAGLLDAAADAIELGALSHAFDMRVAEALPVNGALTLAAYAAAYRKAGLPHLRRHQVSLFHSVGHRLDQAVRMHGVSRLLRASRFPARAAGLGELQQFLERGFSAFAELGGADEFLAKIVQRELEVSRRLFAGDPAPFGVVPGVR